MDGYLVIKGPEAKLRAYIRSFRADPPAAWSVEEFEERIFASSGLTAETFVLFESPEIAGRRYRLSLLITLGRLQIHTMHRIDGVNREVGRVREQLKVIHRFYTDCVKDLLAGDGDLTIEKLNLDVDPEDRDLKEADPEDRER